MEKEKTILIKEGDWCFCDFELQEIQEIKDGVITTVSNGITIHTADFSDRCFPLSKRNKRISDSVKQQKKILLDENSDFYFPEINPYFIRTWAAMCESDNDDDCYSLFNEIKGFTDAAIALGRERLEYDKFKGIRINGVQVFWTH